MSNQQEQILADDVTELRHLLSIAQRPTIKALIKFEIDKRQSQLSAAIVNEQVTFTPRVEGTISLTKIQPVCKISNYAWDQSEKFVKIYLTIDGLSKSDSENNGKLNADFKSCHFEYVFKDKRYEWAVRDLLSKIEPEGSSFKVKTDSILLMLKKERSGFNWSHLTINEQRLADKKPKVPAPKMGDESGGGDPQDSLMTMMKQLYDDGDDEMKRTMKKSWYESQQAKGNPDHPRFPETDQMTL